MMGVSHMEMNVHHDEKTVDIWLTRSEARDEASSFKYFLRELSAHFPVIRV